MWCWCENTIISKLVETRNNSKHLIEYLDDDIRPLVLILLKMSGYVKTFKDKGGDKNKDNMSLRIDDNKLFEKDLRLFIWTKIKDF